LIFSRSFEEKDLDGLVKLDVLKAEKVGVSLIHGFPEDFMLPESRVRWMKLLGNSVSVPVVEMLGRAIVETGVFDGG
jgi:DNA (cytosine-5)-methyltransferase 1